MHVEEAILSRRSVRAFSNREVPLETVKAILQTAARAPSGTNMQPWHAWAIAGDVKDRFSKAVMERRELSSDEDKSERRYYPEGLGEPYLARRRKVGLALYGMLGIGKGEKERMWQQQGRNYLFFDAPVGLIFSIDKSLELGSWLDFGMFLQNVMLAARGHGLHTCPQAAWTRYHRVIRDMLEIPDSHAIVCGICLGFADPGRPESNLPTEREPLEVWANFAGFAR